jgi:predicted HTH domain antitoxin
MQTIQLELPEEPLLSLKETPEEFAKEIKLLAAIKLFELGRLSSGRAAQLAGLSRVAFLMKLKDYKISPISLSRDELKQDLANA